LLTLCNSNPKPTLLDVGRLLVGAGRVAANHLRVLGNSNTLSLDNLDVVETAKNLVLNLELCAHGEFGTLLDVEGLVLEGGLAARGRKVDGDRRASRRVHCQGENDTDSGVVGVGDVGTAAETKGLLVSLERLIAGVWRIEMLVWLQLRQLV
jgi:hypothetical protein